MCAEIVDRGRGPEIEGTRVTVYRILDFVREGVSSEQTAAELDLTAEQVQAALDYIAANRADVEATYETIVARCSPRDPAKGDSHASPEEVKRRILARGRHEVSHAAAGGQ